MPNPYACPHCHGAYAPACCERCKPTRIDPTLQRESEHLRFRRYRATYEVLYAEVHDRPIIIGFATDTEQGHWLATDVDDEPVGTTYPTQESAGIALLAQYLGVDA